MDVDPQCPVCGLDLESTLHLYRECLFTCLVWCPMDLDLSQFLLMLDDWLLCVKEVFGADKNIMLHIVVVVRFFWSV